MPTRPRGISVAPFAALGLLMARSIAFGQVAALPGAESFPVAIRIDASDAGRDEACLEVLRPR